jgi:hypothetical protein
MRVEGLVLAFGWLFSIYSNILLFFQSSTRGFIRKVNTKMYAWCMALPEYYRRKLVLSFVIWGSCSWALSADTLLNYIYHERVNS